MRCEHAFITVIPLYLPRMVNAKSPGNCFGCGDPSNSCVGECGDVAYACGTSIGEEPVPCGRVCEAAIARRKLVLMSITEGIAKI